MKAFYNTSKAAADHATEQYGERWVEHWYIHPIDLPDGTRDYVLLRKVQPASRAKHRDGKRLATSIDPRKSVIDRPVERARTIFGLLDGKCDRNEMIAECLRQGIGKGTASTQYSKWVRNGRSTPK